MLLETAGTILISIYLIVTAWLLDTPVWFAIMMTVISGLLIIWSLLRWTKWYKERIRELRAIRHDMRMLWVAARAVAEEEEKDR